MSSNKQYQLTEEQIQEYKDRLRLLQNILIPNNRKSLESATEQGDLSENSEYDEAKDEQAKLHQEVSEIKYILGKATLIKKTDNKDFVEIGHTVKLHFLDSQKIESLRLLGSIGDGVSTISVESKLGDALLGKKVNEIFSYEGNKGNFYSVKVLEIE